MAWDAIVYTYPATPQTMSQQQSKQPHILSNRCVCVCVCVYVCMCVCVCVC